MVEQNKMQPGRGGCIINMSSVNAVMAIPTIAGYNASKGGVNNLTRQASHCKSQALQSYAATFLFTRHASDPSQVYASSAGIMLTAAPCVGDCDIFCASWQSQTHFLCLHQHGPESLPTSKSAEETPYAAVASLHACGIDIRLACNVRQMWLLCTGAWLLP